MAQINQFQFLNSKEEFEEKIQTQICYDIWQMYNCMGIFGELIYRLQMHIRVSEGQYPSECNHLYKTIVAPD